MADQFVEELDPESVLLVRRDATWLLDGLSPGRVTTIWERCAEKGAYFFGRSRVADGAQWMRQVIALCDLWLLQQPSVPALSAVDLYEGRELADRVLDGVREFESTFGPRTANALAECVRSCCPDLAFRLLLRALSSAAQSPDHTTLSQGQYVQMPDLAWRSTTVNTSSATCSTWSTRRRTVVGTSWHL
ncbi:hypothetical protein MUK60_00975 [Streptomyces sp. LRE541]|uniref:hypothetical protein n=1 Tax=Streptomyces sp. LRE541 TaxID=2931983 RepID=UPI00200BE93F|nr:hypothetical protein [Streptomyces sp. LRE541]UPZ26501.1 hypothetical protein MUK60_00975 [Streptomyces sp. LRE541]